MFLKVVLSVSRLKLNHKTDFKAINFNPSRKTSLALNRINFNRRDQLSRIRFHKETSHTLHSSLSKTISRTLHSKAISNTLKALNSIHRATSNIHKETNTKAVNNIRRVSKAIKDSALPVS